MRYQNTLDRSDLDLAARRLDGFVPDEIFDIHTHPYHSAHFPPGEWPFLAGLEKLGCEEHRSDLRRYMGSSTIHGLYFGMPRRSADRPAMNAWVAEETRQNGTALSRCLLVASPSDDRDEVASALRSGTFCGIKVYHCYAPRPDTMHAGVEEYAPEWMWEILHEVRGVLMLHIVRDGAIEDAKNQADLRRLCRSYSGMRLVLAHVARSFCYRNARRGLHSMADLENVVVDTSAVCEMESFRAAFRILGPHRVLWGSDYTVSEMRGRCVTTGDRFFWLHPELIQTAYQPPTRSDFTLVGIESLLSLREACEDEGLSTNEVNALFFGNAVRWLEPCRQRESAS